MSSSFSFSFVVLNFIIIRTKNLYGINNKSNGVTNKLQMNPVHPKQFLPNLHNWTSVNRLFQAQLASSKRMEIWQTSRFLKKLWNEHNFEYGSSAKLSTINALKPSITYSAAVSHVRSLRSNVRKASKFPVLYIHDTAIFDFNSGKKISPK